MGWSRRSVLASLAGLGVVGLSARGAAPARRLVVVVSSGGWDPSFTVDPKPHVTAGGPYPDLDPDDPLDLESLGSWGEITVSLNAARRPAVTRFFDTWADRALVVNGLWTGSLSHWTAMDRLLTGTDAAGAPDFAVIAGAEAGGSAALAALDLSGLSRLGPYAPRCARVGVRAQLDALLDPSIRLDAPDGRRPEWQPTGADRAAIRAFLEARGGRRAPEWEDRLQAMDAADRVRALAPDLVGQLPYGRRSGFADQVPYAVQLLATDTCNAVVMGTGLQWDTHADAGRQHESWNGTFAGLGELASALDLAGLLSDTVVVALSELGRTPERNAQGGTGHWPYTSAIVFGGAIDGRRVLGGTDDRSIGLGVDRTSGRPRSGAPLLDTGTFAAGLLTSLGVDPQRWLPGIEPLGGLF